MRGRDYLEGLTSEASLRTAIGRVYFAAYLECRFWCENHLGYQRQQLGREHKEVARLLNPRNPDITDNLTFLRAYRNTADYDLGVSVTTLQDEYRNAIDRAKLVISFLEALPIPEGSHSGSGRG